LPGRKLLRDERETYRMRTVGTATSFDRSDDE
jgi:hypothetical protein